MTCKCDVCGKAVSVGDLADRGHVMRGRIPDGKDSCKDCLAEIQKVINRVYDEQQENTRLRIDHAVKAFLAAKEKQRVETKPTFKPFWWPLKYSPSTDWYETMDGQWKSPDGVNWCPK